MRFFVKGVPKPKQSFRVSVMNGRVAGYISKDVSDWLYNVKQVAKFANYKRRQGALFDGKLHVSIYFYLPDKRRRDLDNLSKNVLDALNKDVIADDANIYVLHLVKVISKKINGAVVVIEEM